MSNSNLSVSVNFEPSDLAVSREINLIAKRARLKNITQMIIPHETHTTSACSERTRGDLGEAFVSKMCFGNTGCFRTCLRKIV